MFDNIGGKIKALSKIICWIGIILSILLGIAMVIVGIFSIGNGGLSMILTGVGTIIAGALISWIGSFMTYGFGELIEKTAQIEENTRK